MIANLADAMVIIQEQATTIKEQRETCNDLSIESWWLGELLKILETNDIDEAKEFCHQFTKIKKTLKKL